MENTIMTRDRVVAFRLSYLFDKPERFDIIVFPAPDKPETLFVKRIIGLPGEAVTIVDGAVYIDGERLDDSAFVRDAEVSVQNLGPFHVPESSYFVMGDNRNNSSDSREWLDPFVYRDNILGRVIFRYFRGFRLY
jgi:signal peptidase I